MAVKKTELYSSLWASCDALRGGMDASQYKDYILTLLFMKYVTDKYKGQKYGDLIVFDKANDPNPDPEKRTGCSFDDFIALKNKKNIGEGIDKIIARLAEVNEGLKGVIDIAHFNDETKIGKNKEMVDKLTKLISIFQRPELDFSKNKAEGDDIIGDAYEYLMRNFASESGKSKGQFYTPAEVSRILAKIIGIDKCSDHDATVCDPACGSGSLLIRALEEAPFEISGYGQEKDSSTAGLAKMNAVLHNKATIKIMAGNTFSDPQFKKAEDASELERFDYIVANPPFSLKNWADGLKEFGRFSGYGDRPPEKNGDYAWLMHILKTLKSTGKAAVILPHGVLFRGNAEATIRQKIIDKGWIKGIISLPPNLFYGTGIPACIIVIDKEGAKNRSGIFMIDASKGYIKEGSKNRLREQDIYRIVTTFNEKITTDPKYARFVLNKEIKEKNEYNLNISRYIDSSDSEDIQDIYAHIHGGIPIADIDALEHFWKVFPSLKDELFDVFSEGYYKLNVEEDVIRQTIYSNEEFIAYGEKIDEAFSNWRNYADAKLKNLRTDISTKDLIVKLAQSILREFEDLSLINKYDVYQILLAYWNEELSDDVSMIISDEAGYGAARKTENIMKETKKTDANGNPKLKVVGWEGKLIPKKLISPIDFATLKACPELEKMEYFSIIQGSLFKLTKDEYEFIIDLIREENPVPTAEKNKDEYSKEKFLDQVYMTEAKYDRLVAVLTRKKNIILQGAPGVGKTYAAKRLAYSMMGEKDDDRIEFVQFHQNYSYEDFMMGYKPVEDGFELKYGIFYRFCQKAANHPDKDYFFIIDEINRGNMSKIFGELLMLIEADYRETKTTLAYNGLSFSVPKRLHIIGMMNTADRSLAMIDYALRRRFSFFDMEPGFDSEGFIKYQEAFANDTFNTLIDRIKELNREIANDKSLGKGFCIGHSYFCNTKECTDEWMQDVVDFDILPMLAEYWFDDTDKLQRWENILHGVFQ